MSKRQKNKELPPNETEGSGRREELMNVAIKLFSRKGFKGTSIRDIADAHDVSVSNIYHYFGNKEGLWLAILEHSVKDLPKRLAASMRGRTDPLERFKILVRTHLETVERHHRESRIFFVDESMLSPEGAKWNRNVHKGIFDVYVKEMTALNKAGLIRTENIKITCLNVLALVNWHLRWFREDGPLPAETLQDYIIDFALHGILAAKPETKPCSEGRYEVVQ